MHSLKILENPQEKPQYDITGFGYVCQICGHKVDTRPPEWCPKCQNHRILFKKTLLSQFN
ncbi:MAG: hypothetical protein JW946_05500 [Candidatus Omnitrophica bacterium]|nr:hypothetical protein [Candidatus Omnitrophota bacterium]